MPAGALVQTRIDPAVKERAAEVLEKLGLTVSEAVRILLTRTANEGIPPFLTENPTVHDTWFRAKVQQAWTIRVRPFLTKKQRRTSPSAGLPQHARCDKRCDWSGLPMRWKTGTLSSST